MLFTYIPHFWNIDYYYNHVLTIQLWSYKMYSKPTIHFNFFFRLLWNYITLIVNVTGLVHVHCNFNFAKMYL